MPFSDSGNPSTLLFKYGRYGGSPRLFMTTAIVWFGKQSKTRSKALERVERLPRQISKGNRSMMHEKPLNL
jgi:hypothetical protein